MLFLAVCNLSGLSGRSRFSSDGDIEGLAVRLGEDVVLRCGICVYGMEAGCAAGWVRGGPMLLDRRGPILLERRCGGLNNSAVYTTHTLRYVSTGSELQEVESTYGRRYPGCQTPLVQR